MPVRGDSSRPVTGYAGQCDSDDGRRAYGSDPLPDTGAFGLAQSELIEDLGSFDLGTKRGRGSLPKFPWGRNRCQA